MRRGFGELEGAILQVFQEKKNGVTVREMLFFLRSKDRYTTVMTVMNRLVNKGDLTKEKEGSSYRYFAKESKAKFSILERWKKRFFAGKTASMVAYLLGSAEKISAEEIEEMEKLLERLKQKDD